MTPSERRFAPTTVRQARNGVRYGLEQVSAFIGIRSKCFIPDGYAHKGMNLGAKQLSEATKAIL